MHWKHDLIARVNARVHAAPVALPPHATLANAPKNSVEYLRVALSGTYVARDTALVRAATELGTGYWVMTVLKKGDGRKVWINRGFLPAGTAVATARASTPSGPVRIVGLLRATEPGGSLLQSNKPDQDRWYSRDTVALAKSRHAGDTEPAFVDVQEEYAKEPSVSAKPVAGLTVIHFPDNHLGYALTWFALAALSIFGIFLAWRRSGRSLA